MRLIDADELLRRYDEEHEGPPGRARKLIEEAPTVGGWISVKDRMPDMGVKCVIYRDGKMSVARHIANNDWITQAFFTYPTHWMPLSEPLKENVNGNMDV